MPEKIKRLTAVEAREPYKLYVEFEDGIKGVVDMSKYVLKYKTFIPFRENPTAWESAQITDWGWAVGWPGDIDMDGHNLYRNLLEQTGQSMHPRDFAEWMERHGLTYDTAAQTLGISRRNIAYFKNGNRIIPRYIRLACIGFDAEEKHRKAS